MAKAAEFNMAQAIRDVLSESPQATQGECMAAIQAKYPKQTLNVNSFGVALSSQRKKLGITVSKGAKPTVRRPKPAKARAKAPAVNGTGTISIGGLTAAKQLIREAGGVDQARQALSTLETLLQ